MAYGSATIPVRTKTSTKTSSKSTTRTKTTAPTARPVASTSELPRKSFAAIAATDSEDDDDDPEFGAAARREAKRDSRPSGKGKGKAGKSRKLVDSSDEDTGERRRSTKSKPVTKKRKSQPGDEKRKEIEERTGIRFAVSETSDYDSSADEREKRKKRAAFKAEGMRRTSRGSGNSSADSDEDPEEASERREHLKGRWRSTKFMRENPHAMSARRKRLEEKFNPLIKLLNIKIEVIGSEDEKYTAGGGVTSNSDESSSEDSEDDVKPAIKSDPEKSSGGQYDLSSDFKSDQKPFNTLDPESDPEPETESEGDEDSPPVAFKTKSGIQAAPPDEDEEFEEDAFERRERIAKEAKEKKAKALALAKEKEAEEAALAAHLARAREDVERMAQVVAQDRDAMDVDDEEAEPSSLAEERRRNSQIPKTKYPRRVVKGRPKFEVKTAEQDEIGPLVLAEGVEVTSFINMFLRPYQREGIEFMYRQYAAGKGGILGDDMGLGKTIQAIGFLSAIMKKTGRAKYDSNKRKDRIREVNVSNGDAFPKPSELGPTCLIACPASVVHNWTREFQTWGYFDVGVYEGSKQQKEATLTMFKNGYYDVLIASIDGVRHSHDELSPLDFTIVIVDEAHRLKNPKSKTTKAFHEFSSKIRIGLTGTAIQNRLEEFWCLLNWANPKSVGTKDQWNYTVSTPLKYGQKLDATPDELATGRTRAAALVGLLLPKMFIRRTKDLIKDQLPKKKDMIVLCPLTPLQTSAYQRLLLLPEVQDIVHAYDPCPCGARDRKGRPYKLGKCCRPNWSKNIFKYISLFQKISNHLALIYADKEDGLEKYEQDVEYMQTAFPSDYNERRIASLNTEPELCGKWLILKALFERWYANGDKVLVFSLSLKILAFVKTLMEETHYPFVSLDGSVAPADRMGLVDQFNDNPDMFCFIISTRAGGVGLNLTSANKVVIFDPNWNPSHDLQAMDRSYRMGQTRDVDVYRLIGCGTLEELIYNRQQYKRGLSGLGYDATAEQRLYSGVEGETSQESKGELWGCKNIFTFRPQDALTEMSIKTVQIQDLEYALRNASAPKVKASKGKGKGKKKSGSSSDEEDGPELIDDAAALERLLNGEDEKAPSKSQEDQDAISQILANCGVTTTVISDSTLGGSRTEEDRGRKAIKEAVRAKASESKPNIKAPAKRPAAVASTAWNPLARGKPKLDLKPDIKPTPMELDEPESSQPPAGFNSLKDELGISASVPLSELIAPSGYKGHKGVDRLTTELRDLSKKEYERRIRGILTTYVERKGR